MKRALLLLLVTCTPKAAAPPAAIAVDVAPAPPGSAAVIPMPTPEDELPDYLARLTKNGEVQTRGPHGEILPPRPDDNTVLRGYVKWKPKGALSANGHQRLTIMTAKLEYAPKEEIRVIHVHEATEEGAELYVMGPKAIYGEYLDGRLASPAVAAPTDAAYDGAVVKAPGEDHNYDVSVYRLPPGIHTIEWSFQTLSGDEVLTSNKIAINVR